MVCQSATQTRFRALKHENGMIVHIIACFHPLQDCQAEYFRALLNPLRRFRRNFFMGKDCKPRQLCNFNHASNVGASVFPNHADPYGFASGEKRFMVFDHSKNQTNLIYNSVGYNGDVNEEEMHEDTEEIDALLYSDSDNYDDEEEEGLPPPVKKCRIEYKLDPALADTASSTNCGNGERERSKREKIQDTVRVLRGIIPDSKGKDAASVLDEAIQYLRSLKLKAKVPGTTSDLK